MIMFMLTFFTNAFCTQPYEIISPDAKISVNFWLTNAGAPVYSISYSGSTILKQSKLGIIRSDDDFTINLDLDSVSNVNVVSENYTLLHGKRLNCSYSANRRVFYLKNTNSKVMEIIFQVSNDGIGFRYYFSGKTDTPIIIFK